MRVARIIVPVFCIVVVAIVIFSNNTKFTSAEAAPVCSVMSTDDLKTATASCGKADPNSVCLGHTGVTANLIDGSAAGLNAAGDQVDLSKVATVTTSVTDPKAGSAGVAVLKLQDGSFGVLFGDASLTLAPAAAGQATQEAQPTSVATESASAGAAQAFTLNTAVTTKVSCGVVPSGLLIQSSGDQMAHYLVNGVDVTFNSGTILLRARPNDRLEVAAITGKASVAVGKASVVVDTGNWTRVRIGGKDTLTATTSPPAPTSYPFAALDGAPLDFLPTVPACTVGLPTSAGKVSVRVGPGTERGPLFYMTADQNFLVKGQGKDSKGAMWWQIQADNRQEAWVAQSEVHTVGPCDTVAQATPPPVIIAASVPDQSTDNTSGATSEPVTQGFAPTGLTIWNAAVGPLTTSGVCNKVPVAYCDQLVALTPSGTGLQWKGQELQPYYMRRIRENVYAYAGPNPLGDAQISLTIEFTSQTGFRATQVMTPNDDPTCKDSFTFSGTFLR